MMEAQLDRLSDQRNTSAVLPIVCLASGEMNGLADLYIRRLHAMLQAQLARPFKLYCYTDRQRDLPSTIEQHDCAGWDVFARHGEHPTLRKLALFDPARVAFDEFLYLDLTLVIRKPLEPMVEFALQHPAALLTVRDWHHPGSNSSVMRIRKGPFQAIPAAYLEGRRYRQTIPGDQDFLNEAARDLGLLPLIAHFPEGMVISYKQTNRIGRKHPAQARKMIHDAFIVKFHGKPRMNTVFTPAQRLFRSRLEAWFYGQWKSPIPLDELRAAWLVESARH